jgi:hypothetical protein
MPSSRASAKPEQIVQVVATYFKLYPEGECDAALNAVQLSRADHLLTWLWVEGYKLVPVED